jgi:type I restriction enzyme S subunit
VPSLQQQSRIANILSAYDDLIENNRRRIALLEEAARLLYREWFVHFRFPGHEHVRIIDGQPEGWKRRYLGDVVTTQYGHTASAEDEEIGPKFLRGTDINKRSFVDWSSVPFCPERELDFEKYALSPGDLLVIRMADPGKVALVEKQVRAVFASYLVRLKVKDPDDVPPLYLFMVLRDDRYQGFIGASSGGSTRKSASAKLLTDFHFITPPQTLLQIFIEQMLPIRAAINNLVDQSAALGQARDLLLPRLMNGEIAV